MGNRKNRGSIKKNRTTSLVFDMGEPVELRSATYSSDGRVTIATQDGRVLPSSAWVERTYPRPKGEKGVNRLRVEVDALVSNPDLALTQYDRVFAVDTNCPTPEQPPTFTGVVEAQVNEIKPTVYGVCILRDLVIEIHDVENSGERFGWWLVISSIRDRPAQTRVALVVDAHLSDIPAINRREQPVFGRQILPEGIHLVYASADKGNESIANRLLSRADRNAQEIAEVYQRPNVIKPPLQTTREAGAMCHFRTWQKHGPAG